MTSIDTVSIKRYIVSHWRRELAREW
jgi:hypothetical protein